MVSGICGANSSDERTSWNATEMSRISWLLHSTDCWCWSKIGCQMWVFNIKNCSACRFPDFRRRWRFILFICHSIFLFLFVRNYFSFVSSYHSRFPCHRATISSSFIIRIRYCVDVPFNHFHSLPVCLFYHVLML